MGTNTTFGLKTGWGTSGTLTTGDTSKFVSLQANFADAQGAGSYTVEFSRGTNVNADNPIFATAIVQISVEGTTIQRMVSVGDGASLTCVGQSVRIRIIDATFNPPGVGPQVAVDYGVSVTIAPGERGSNKQPPTFVLQVADVPLPQDQGGFFQIPAGQTRTIPVPQDAGAVSLYVTAWNETTFTNAVGELTIEQSFGPISPGVATKVYDAANYRDWVPLAPGVTFINLVNHSTHDYTGTVTLGIEG
jgi:hypothetical protein